METSIFQVICFPGFEFKGRFFKKTLVDSKTGKKKKTSFSGSFLASGEKPVWPSSVATHAIGTAPGLDRSTRMTRRDEAELGEATFKVWCHRAIKVIGPIGG